MQNYTMTKTVEACRISEIGKSDNGMCNITFCCGKTVTYGPQFVNIYQPTVGDYLILGNENTKVEVLGDEEFRATYESTDAGAFPDLPAEEVIVTPDDIDDETLDSLFPADEVDEYEEDELEELDLLDSDEYEE